MTPDTLQAPPNGAQSPEKWLCVSEAAAVLGVSEKTVWRRAKGGKLTARKVAGGRGGFIWEIALDAVPDSTGQPTDRPDSQSTGQPDKPTGQNGRAAAIHAQIDRTKRPDKSDRPTGQATGHEGEMTIRLLGQLETENAFLRATVEQLQRDGAETRAALREALKLAPKAITAGETAQNGPQNGAAGGNGLGALNGAQIAPEREETGLSYGDIADMLEKEMSG